LRASEVKCHKHVIADGLEETGGARLARPPGQKQKRGRFKKSKARNLLERLMEHEDATLRFMTGQRKPFSNNYAERPVRMIKARRKISGCGRALEMAVGFCKMRGHIESCEKNGLSSY
jgi:transposase